jgi:DNA-binding MarR family transcriptional regulator
MLKSIEFPQHLDVLLIIDDKATKSKILKVLDRSKDYITRSLKYLEAHGLVILSKGKLKDSKILLIELTPKGRDVQNILITLYNIMGLRK